MTDPPTVSIFMPTYRRADSGLLRAAVESVLAQDYRDFELLVADDGSTDSTARVLTDLAARDARVRPVRYEHNSGLPARRIAELLTIAKGKYCAYMFDDDLWYPHALRVLVDALEEHPSWDMTYGNVVFPSVNAQGLLDRGRVLGREPRDFDAGLLRVSNYIPNVAVVHRREILDRVGTYDPHILLRRLCDWDLWLRIAAAGTIGHTDVVIGEANGWDTPDSLGRTASLDPELTQRYMSLDRDARLHPQKVLDYPVDGLEVFGPDAPPMLAGRAAREFVAFYRQIGDEGRAGEWERTLASERDRTPGIAAVVVLYNPAEDVLDNVDSYRGQVDTVIAVDNTGSPDRRLVQGLESRGVDYVSLGGNRGIAAALNEGCRRARDLGYAWVITFDQDSTATPGMVARLSATVELDQPLARRIAIVAPVWQQVGGLPAATAPGCLDLDVALTSGSLTRQSALAELGGFREDLFIDRVDNEFCLRARRRGWRIVQRGDAVLLHRMGDLRRVTFPVRCWVSDYSPVRRYYMVRNLLEVRREYGRDFPGVLAEEKRYWSREILKIVLAEPHRLQKLKMMVRGWLDYRRGRFGKYEDLHP
jgi:rhamnosyltransferase